MRWGCSVLPMLQIGEWPPDPKGTGYTDGGIKSGVRIPSKAAEDFTAEIEARLKTCGRDGQDLVYLLVNNGTDVQLTPGTQQVLKYISGWRRKRQSYKSWKYENKGGQDGRKTCSHHKGK